MRIFFININKSGGAIVEKAFGLPHQHGTVKDFVTEFGRDEWDKGFKFTFVRNPWDRALAIYDYRNIKKQKTRLDPAIEFPEWIKLVFQERDPQYYDNSKWTMPQTDWLTDDEGQININRIARFENIVDDIERLSIKLDLSAKLPSRKVSNRADFRKRYDSASIDIVSQWFAEDVENFGYQFE